MSTLRVMTFNIRGAYHDDGVNRWEQRAGLNVETILRHTPDLIGFQELQHGNLEVYQKRLTEYAYALGPRAFNEEPHEYNAIFWKPSRLTMLAQGGFWLSETPEEYSSSWNAGCVRVAHWESFHLLDANIKLLHINTHLDHASEQARVEGARLILQRLPLLCHEQEPVILTGDFNCEPASPPYSLFLEGGFVDTYQSADNKHSNTFHDFGRITPVTGDLVEKNTMRIDWILQRDRKNIFTPSSCTIIHDARLPLYPSDHYPLITDFIVRPRG
ncbi:endonuclease/exonuclease/phosphatase family protein [Ktedonosporobacter rubrisoli]|uniref:Endonuclease/exonuclease/phosphatase family protein n=1 Tax=Ktedonosporobacter rubrisoli TaxID=2509675 RepID=A0A4V0YYU5_KTERU|nr:endonuclease/exonuclease/phosphatase family protein [Ktedonosporobacter rubrisoli]QBD77441.1 endonuclease/exonuclease/phosphatase family protein [Ktedonosporobacter rubrisoli]